MRMTPARLRQIIIEEIEALPEASRDQDGDGDNDFDDVRVARYTAGGMPKGSAVAKVKRKPLAKNEATGRFSEGIDYSGPVATFRGIMAVCENALNDKSVAWHPEAAKMYRNRIESLLRAMSDVETTPYRR
jgi:hypothetical protein